MNERIRELAEQANTSFFIQSDGNLTPELEKFAELIVRECVEKCKTDWYGDSLDDICKQMLKHFGVDNPSQTIV